MHRILSFSERIFAKTTSITEFRCCSRLSHSRCYFCWLSILSSQLSAPTLSSQFSFLDSRFQLAWLTANIHNIELLSWPFWASPKAFVVVVATAAVTAAAAAAVSLSGQVRSLASLEAAVGIGV